MGKKKHEEGTVMCPVGQFFSCLENFSREKSSFFKHMNRSRIEFLKAVRSLVDEKIEDFEKKNSKKVEKKMTKIKVE